MTGSKTGNRGSGDGKTVRRVRLYAASLVCQALALLLWWMGSSPGEWNPFVYLSIVIILFNAATIGGLLQNRAVSRGEKQP